MNTQRGGHTPDELDRRLIKALGDAPELTNRALAARLEISESTCAYRRRRLRESGVIGPIRLEVDHAQLGYGFQAIITVFMASHSREAVREFQRHMTEAPQVLQVSHLTGRADFMVHVAVRDAESLRDFILSHVTIHPGVRGTETHIVFDTLRGSWRPHDDPRGAVS